MIIKTMTQENKELLLRDLSARLPYGVICNDNCHGSSRVTNIDITPDDIEHKNPKVVLYYFDFDECGELKNCKPYLRPMSSMTEEEKKDLKEHTCPDGTGTFDEKYLMCPMSHYGECISYEFMSDILSWLNAHHFDYRGLIEKGLALEAPEGMYK